MAFIMKLGAIAVLFGMLFFVAPMVQADNGLYGGALYGNVEYEEGSASLDMGATSFILGGSFNDYVSSEFRYGSGINSDSIYGVTMDLDNYYGAYVLFTLPVNQYVQPYIVGGYTKAEVTISHPYYGSTTDTGSGTSLGFGIRCDLNNHFSLRLERMDLIDRDSYVVSQTSIAANWQF